MYCYHKYELIKDGYGDEKLLFFLHNMVRCLYDNIFIECINSRKVRAATFLFSIDLQPTTNFQKLIDLL